MPSPLRNGDNRSGASSISPHRIPPPSPAAAAAGSSSSTPHRHYNLPLFHSTISNQKLRRFNTLILLLRFASFCFALAAAVFMGANSSRSPASPSWSDFDLFRFVLAANAIVAAYSLAEMGAAIWEMLKGTTPLPESLQLWFDFSHDQVFAYMLLSAEASGTVEARNLRRGGTCSTENAFCIQAYISVALGFVGFAFLAISAIISGYRLVSHFITGSRYHFFELIPF